MLHVRIKYTQSLNTILENMINYLAVWISIIGYVPNQDCRGYGQYFRAHRVYAGSWQELRQNPDREFGGFPLKSDWKMVVENNTAADAKRQCYRS